MFIWDFVADKILGQIVDWFYGQVVGFLGNFFAEMGNMGVELFEMSWVQSIVLFFSYLAWALYGTGLVVACFECGIEYSSGRGNIRETALNAIKGFMAVSLFTVVPVRLYELSVTLQGQLTAGITGYGASIGDVASDIMQEFSAVESLTDLTSGPFLGFGSITSGIMILFCIILTVTMGAAHPTCIPCSKAAKKRSPPPREDCAFLLDPGEVHDGPPRRTHSTGDLIQRKNSGIVAEYRIYFNIEMGQAASVYTCYLPCRNRYFFFMDRNSIYPRLPRGSN